MTSKDRAWEWWEDLPDSRSGTATRVVIGAAVVVVSTVAAFFIAGQIAWLIFGSKAFAVASAIVVAWFWLLWVLVVLASG